jgi:hypothetical protein
MDRLPIEIIDNIFSYLPGKLILKQELLSKFFLNFVRNNKWYYPQFILKNLSNFNFIVDNYDIMNFDFSQTGVDDNQLLRLRNCHTLKLFGCELITDKSVKELKNCHTLDLSWTNITDESVKELKKCHTLNLSHCNLITDKSELTLV